MGLMAALQDAGNWSGVPPAGTAAVVSRAQGSAALVDPLGGLAGAPEGGAGGDGAADQPVRSGEGDDADLVHSCQGDAGDGRESRR